MIFNAGVTMPGDYIDKWSASFNHKNSLFLILIRTKMRAEQTVYYVYILTNYKKTVLYTGVTNSLERRIMEHYEGKNPNSFTSSYAVYYLLYYEIFDSIILAIAREKEIKGWRRSKKEDLIKSFNKEWKFLNKELFGIWPPGK
jgi:putative endonuclease